MELSEGFVLVAREQFIVGDIWAALEKGGDPANMTKR
jgi:hypothetical protein